jgi:hypothetical protein
MQGEPADSASGHIRRRRHPRWSMACARLPAPFAERGCIQLGGQTPLPASRHRGLPTAEAQVQAATQAPIATIALTQPTGVPAWKTIPSWAVVGTADHAIPPALQLAMAENTDARITEVHARTCP